MRLSVLFFSLMSTVALGQELVTLEEVIALTLKDNFDVRLMQNAAQSTHTDNKHSVGLFLPQINGNAATMWNDTHQDLEFENAANNRSGDARANNTTASVQAVWTLFDGTKMFATRARLEEIAVQGEMKVKNQMVNSIAAVITNYYNIVRQKQQLRAIQEMMSVNEERLKLAERKLEVGTGARPELLQAKVDLNAQRTLAIQQETLINQLKDQLNGLVGLKLPQQYEVADTIIINLNILYTDIVDNIEHNSYQLQATRQNISIAQRTLHESFGSLSPVINATGAYNFSKTNNTKLINPFAPLQSQNSGLNYGFTISIPILNGLATSRSIQQSHINVRRQKLVYEQQKQVVDVAVRNAYVNYDNTKKILAIEEENILLAKENVVIALERFKRGATTFVELRAAQESLETAYNRLIAARYDAKVAETELLRLNGSLLK